MQLLHIHLGLVNQSLLEMPTLLPTEPLRSVGLEGDASVTRTREYEEGFAAEDDHESLDVEFVSFIKRRSLNIPLYEYFIERSDPLGHFHLGDAAFLDRRLVGGTTWLSHLARR